MCVRVLMVFTKRSPRDHKILLNSKYHFFWLQKWIELGHVSQVANFSLSSHHFGKVAVIHNISKITKRVSYGAAMLDDMPWLESQKLATWPTWPSFIYFWSQKKWHLLFKTILWWRDVTWKPRIRFCVAERQVLGVQSISHTKPCIIFDS